MSTEQQYKDVYLSDLEGKALEISWFKRFVDEYHDCVIISFRDVNTGERLVCKDHNQETIKFLEDACECELDSNTWTYKRIDGLLFLEKY